MTATTSERISGLRPDQGELRVGLVTFRVELLRDHDRT